MADLKYYYSILLHFWLTILSNGWLFSNDNCYDRLGCFPVTGHFTNSMGFAPDSPRQMRVSFIYKGRQRREDISFNAEETEEMIGSVFEPSLKTVVIIHGYIEDPTRPWIVSMVEALHRLQEPVNVLVVDWSRGAGSLIYFQGVANARVAGAVVALVLQDLIQLGSSPADFHIIGFSLGAHVAAYAGARIPGLGRITGLDPAGPGFLHTHPSVRLDPSDATMVDVVHTDNQLGTLTPFGTIDFYPNGGADQPGCQVGAINRISSLMSRMDFSRNTVSRTVGCSHLRAPDMFTASIEHNCTYTLKRCSDVIQMRSDNGTLCTDGHCPRFGFHLDQSRTSRTGLYRFAATSSRPFC